MSADRLPCGFEVDDIVNQVADGDAAVRTPHQAGCPYCQAALAEYDQLLAPVRELAAEPVTVPDAVLEEVIRRVRGALPDFVYGIIPGPLGITRIAGHLVALTARTTAEHVSGVHVALAKADRRLSDDDSEVTEVTAGVAGISTALRITVAARWGEDLHALADRIRHAVGDAVRTTTGLQPVQIDIVIDDVFPPPS